MVEEKAEVIKTLGEARVRIDFNMSGTDIVTNIKERTAALINLLQAEKKGFRGETSDDIESISAQLARSERNDLVDIAQRKFEEAAMWAVKAATA